MASEQTLKVKLVKCPKCWKILPVLMEMHIYKCGGCGTLLQGKSQENSTGTKICLPEAITSQKNELEDKLETKELKRSNPNPGFLPSALHPLENNDNSDTRKLRHCSGRQLGGVDSKYKDSEDKKSDWSEPMDSDTEQFSIVNQSSGEDTNRINNHNSRDINNLQAEGTNLSIKYVKYGNDQTALRGCSPLSHGHLKGGHYEAGNLSSLDKKNRTDQNKLGECIRETQEYSEGIHQGVVHSHREDNQNGITHSVPQDCNAEQFISEQSHLKDEDGNNQQDQHIYGNCNGDWHEIMNRFISQSGLANCENAEDSSVVGDNFREGTGSGTPLLAGRKSEANLTRENGFNNGKASMGSQESTADLRVKIRAPADVFISSDILLPSPREQLGSSHRRSPYGGLDPYAATEYGDRNSEFSGNLGNASNSSTIRRFHIYDDSVSDYDRTDYQQHYRYSQPLKATNEVPDFVHSSRRSGTERLLVKDIKYRSAGLQGLARSPTPMDKNPNTINSWPGQIYKETTRYYHSIMNSNDSERDQHLFGPPLHQENPLAGCGSGGLSNLSQQNFEKDSTYHSPDRLEGINQERNELLRTVYELEDQLNKRRYMKGVSIGVPTEAAWRELPSCYNKEATEEGLCFNLNYAPSPGRCIGGSSMSKGQKFSRLPYSGEVSNTRHCISDAHSRDSRFSAPLHLSTPHHKFGLTRSQFGYSPYSSIPSSPQLYLDSKNSPIDSELLSIDLTNEDYAIKKRINSGKQHFLPTAGGAPFITCYSCLKLLQLPEDLLPFKRRSLRLRCGSCSSLLKFSFQNRMHVVPYLGNVSPPQHEVHGNSYVSIEENMTLGSHSPTRLDMTPESFWDEYKDSFLRNCPKELDVLPTASYSLQGIASRQNSSDSAPLDPKNYQRDFVRKQSLKKYRDTVETSRVHSPPIKFQSKNTSPETRLLLPTVGSPLHKLMGYASPRKLVYGYETSTDRASTHYPKTRY